MLKAKWITVICKYSSEMDHFRVQFNSQVFSRFSENNFYEFINGYRARKAKVPIEKETGSRKSLLTLAMDAGCVN